MVVLPALVLRSSWRCDGTRVEPRDDILDAAGDDIKKTVDGALRASGCARAAAMTGQSRTTHVQGSRKCPLHRPTWCHDAVRLSARGCALHESATGRRAAWRVELAGGLPRCCFDREVPLPEAGLMCSRVTGRGPDFAAKLARARELEQSAAYLRFEQA